MIKIVKNTTLSDYTVKDTGITIPTSSQYTIPPQDYLLWSASVDVVTGLTSLDLVANDGITDLPSVLGINHIKDGSNHNVIIVHPTGSGVIADAIASVTTASSTNQFIIRPSPGTYVEPQLVMKPFVSIVGFDTQSTIITPLDPTDHLIIGAAATLRYVTVRNVTTAGKAGVYSTASGFQLRNCVIRDNPINVFVEGIASLASITADDLIITGVFTTGIQLKNSGAGVQGVFKSSIFNGVSASSGAKCAVVEGASVSFIFAGLIASGVSTVNCLTVKDGATLKVLAAEIKGFDKAVWAENVGTAPVLDLLGLNLDSNTTDVQIDHTTATGAIQGIVTRSKIINSSPNGVQLSYHDPVNGDLNNTRILATRGFATDLTEIATVNGTVQLVSTDAHVAITTGSTNGTIVQLPNATTLRNGHQFVIINLASVFINTRQFDGSNQLQVNSDFAVRYILKDNSTSAGVWFAAIESTLSTVFDPQASISTLYDDFCNMITWSPSTSGTGSVASVSAGNTVMASGKHLGVAQLTLGNLLAAHAALVQSATLSVSTVFGDGAAEYQSLIFIPTLATAVNDYVFRAGFGTATNADHANGIYFEYNRSISPNWIVKTASQSTRTSVTSSIAVTNNNWIHLRWFVNSAGTLVTFLVNNVVAGTIATNIPVTTGQGCGPNFQLVSTAFLAGSRTVYLDYFYFLKQFTARD